MFAESVPSDDTVYQFLPTLIQTTPTSRNRFHIWEHYGYLGTKTTWLVLGKIEGWVKINLSVNVSKICFHLSKQSHLKVHFVAVLELSTLLHNQQVAMRL